MTHLLLSLPPSVNEIWAPTGKGAFYRSAKYKRWIKDAGWTLLAHRPKPVVGLYNLTIYLPAEMPGDIDNRVKALCDLLVTHGVTADDRHLWSLHVSRSSNIEAGYASVFIYPHTATRAPGGDVARNPAAVLPGGGMEAA